MHSGNTEEPKLKEHEYMYGFGTQFPRVLGELATRNNPNGIEDTIWGHDVPNLLFQLYDEMDIGDKTVNIFNIFMKNSLNDF